MTAPSGEWIADVPDDIYHEVFAGDPIHSRFIFHCFTSRSKGRHRKRRHWQEVELIRDLWSPGRYYRSWHKFPFDTIATEVFGDGEGTEQRLMTGIRRGYA